MTGSTTRQIVRLSDLRAGQAGRLLHGPLRDATGADRDDADRAAAARLANLGFVPGTGFRVLRCAPFGGPIELELRGYRICLRRRDVSGLLAELDPVASRESGVA